LHWHVPPEVIAPLIPAGLELDLADGVAWVGVIPFRMTGVTLRGLPDLPKFSAFHELNVRTYVRHGGKAGVYFLSLDANNRLAVALARAWYALPYWYAVQSSHFDGDVCEYSSRRVRGEARFEGSYRVGGSRAPDALSRWLTERYALFVERRGRVLRGDVHHVPWELRELEVDVRVNTMTARLGFSTPGGPAHAVWSPGVDTVVWRLQAMGGGGSPARME
jgi:uncharacterized protein YqjF (DUF2071 family)